MQMVDLLWKVWLDRAVTKQTLSFVNKLRLVFEIFVQQNRTKQERTRAVACAADWKEMTVASQRIH